MRTLRTGIRVGSELPAHATAIGKVILAYGPSDEFDDYLQTTPLEGYTANSIVTAVALTDRLATIRKQGFTTDFEECHLGVNTVAAPVRDVKGRVFAGLAVTGPATRMDKGAMEDAVSAVVESAGVISRLLGFLEEDLGAVYDLEGI